MSSHSLRCVAVSVAVFACLFVSAPVFADTYQTVSLGTDADWFLYGMDDAGTVVLDNSVSCNTGTCYATYTDGVYGGITTTPPVLSYDDGSACSLAPAGYVVEHAVCNDGRVAWTGYVDGNPSEIGVFDGPDPAADYLAYGGEGPLMLTANGDIVWDDHFSEEFYEAIDTATTPEPGSWALALTGVLALGAHVRRRRIA